MVTWIKWQHQWDAAVSQIRSTIGRRDGQDAEDLLNSALIKMIENPKPEVVHEPAYAQAVARNLHRDGQRRHEHTRTQSISVAAWQSIPDKAPLPEDVWDARDRVRRVCEVFLRLSPRCRQIVMMNRIDGLTFKEISEKLGLSKSAVEKHFYRGMHVLFSAEYDR